MKVRALELDVYSNPHYRHCAWGGWSEDHDELFVKCEEGPFEVDENDPGLFELECHFMGSMRLVPCNPSNANDVGPMMGGSYAGSSDHRWSKLCKKVSGRPFYGVVAVHDRYESWEAYEALSR